MTNVERFWEASVAEAVSTRHPPDQSAEILARLNAPPEPAKRKRVVRWIRYPVELAAAAALIVAIGFATGLIQWPEETIEQSDPERTWAAGPGADLRETESGLQLESGYLLLKTGAPDVRRGDSLFTNLEGVAVVCAGDMPSDEEHSAIQTWLHERKVDEAMIAKATRWAAGAAMCVLMLQGTAQLDGQEVKAAEKTASAPVWHEVASVMDLDRLPRDAKYVRMSGMSAEYLPVVAGFERLEGISFQYGKNFSASHLDALTRLPELRNLDVRGGQWGGRPDYSALAKMKKLQVAGLDLYIPSGAEDEDREAVERLVAEQVVDFRQIAERGVKLNFSASSSASPYLQQLREAFPEIHEMWVFNADDDTCKQLSQFSQLRRLKLDWSKAGELGYVYISRLPALVDLELKLWEAMEESYVHHLSKIKSLRSLVLDCVQINQSHTYVRPGVISVLAGMTQLECLELSQHYWTQLAILDGRSKTPFSASGNLQSFTISVDESPMAFEQIPGGGPRHPFDLGFLVGAKEIRILSTGDRRFQGLARDDVPGGNPELAKRLEVIRTEIRDIRSSEEQWQANWAGALSRYPNLKRVELDRAAGGTGLVWHGGSLAAGVNEKLPNVEVVDVSAR